MPTDYRSPPASLHPERSLGALSAFSDRTVDVSIDDASSGLEGCDHVENVVAAPSSSARHGRRAGGASAAPLTDLAEDTLDLSASFDQLELSGLEAVRAPPAAAEEYAEEEFLEESIEELAASCGSVGSAGSGSRPRGVDYAATRAAARSMGASEVTAARAGRRAEDRFEVAARAAFAPAPAAAPAPASKAAASPPRAAAAAGGDLRAALAQAEQKAAWAEEFGTKQRLELEERLAAVEGRLRLSEQREAKLQDELMECSGSQRDADRMKAQREAERAAANERTRDAVAAAEAKAAAAAQATAQAHTRELAAAAAMAEQARAAAEKQHETALKSQLEIARASAASQLRLAVSEVEARLAQRDDAIAAARAMHQSELSQQQALSERLIAQREKQAR